MARFRRKASRRKGFRAFARRAARRSGVGNSAALFQLDAMIYGAARAPVSNLIGGIIPSNLLGGLGGLSDEVAMGALNYLVAKNTSGMVRNVALKGLVIENARVGEAIVGMTGITGSTPSGNTGSALYG